MEANNSKFKPKLRITTLDDDGRYLSDRLVDATTEMYTGPKISHNGPLRIEVTLLNQQDIDNFKKYLDQLSGNLPIKVSTPGRGRPAAGTRMQVESPREDILLSVENMIKEGKDQSEIIKYLRELGFIFILTEDLLYHFPDFPFDMKDIGKPTDNGQYLKSYSWLVRCIRKAKDPKADKFDPMIMFGFSILKGPSKKVVPYLYKDRKTPLKVAPSKKALSFSTAEFTKFPKYQNADERLKWSTEMRQLVLNKEKKPSKFFTRWAPDILLPDKTYQELKHLGISFANDKRG